MKLHDGLVWGWLIAISRCRIAGRMGHLARTETKACCCGCGRLNCRGRLPDGMMAVGASLMATDGMMAPIWGVVSLMATDGMMAPIWGVVASFGYARRDARLMRMAFL